MEDLIHVMTWRLVCLGLFQVSYLFFRFRFLDHFFGRLLVLDTAEWDGQVQVQVQVIEWVALLAGRTDSHENEVVVVSAEVEAHMFPTIQRVWLFLLLLG
jgi:hypothetical protein